MHLGNFMYLLCKIGMISRNTMVSQVWPLTGNCRTSLINLMTAWKTDMLFLKTITHIHFATFVQIDDNLAINLVTGSFLQTWNNLWIFSMNSKLHWWSITNVKRSNWFKSSNFIIVTWSPILSPFVVNKFQILVKLDYLSICFSD